MANYKAGVRFNIDSVSKKISTPYKDFRLVRDDTNSVVLSFRMPRFISGVDMSGCENVKIFYKNIDPDTGEKHEDALPITDLVIGEGEDCDYVFFTYTIKPGATMYVGVFLIAITFRFGDDYIWSTEPYDGIPVVDRLDTSESIKKNVPPDILEAWKAEIIAEVTAAVEVDEEKIADLVEDYLEKNPPEADLTGYATEKFVTEAIADIEIPEPETAVYHILGGLEGTSIIPKDKAVLQKIYQRLSAGDKSFTVIYGSNYVQQISHTADKLRFTVGQAGYVSTNMYTYSFSDGLLTQNKYPMKGTGATNITDGRIDPSYSLMDSQNPTIGNELRYINDNFARKGDVEFTTDETLTLNPVTKVLSVNTATEANKDNTLPITSAAVATQIGNIEILLSRI